MLTDLQDTGKDTSRSCVFDFPDRPVDSFPPDYPTAPLPPGYPYDPIDDWPPSDPNIPIPGSDPHPHPSVFPPVNPPLTFNDLINYETDSQPGFFLGNQDPPLGPSTGHINMSVGSGVIIGDVAFANKFTPRTNAGGVLLSELGLTATEAGLYFTYCNVGAAWYIYLVYVARGGGGAAFSPVFLYMFVNLNDEIPV
jgi:hypothetical protein